MKWSILPAIVYLMSIGSSFGARKVRYEKERSSGHGPRSSPIDVVAFLGQFEVADWYLDLDLPPRKEEGRSEVASGDYPYYEDLPAYTPAFTTPSATTTTTTSTTTTTTRRQVPLSSYCSKRRGQFAYGPDCHAYVDCWDGQAFLKYCQPRNLVFDQSTMRCRWPNERAVQGRCEEQERVSAIVPPRHEDPDQRLELSRSKKSCSEISGLGYECVPKHLCIAETPRSKSIRSPIFGSVQNGRDEIDPSQRTCPRSGDVCCRRNSKSSSTTSQSQEEKVSATAGSGFMSTLCPSDFSGVVAYPYDCNKFANCWKGKPFIQNCAPGTQFNAKVGQCDFPHKANCKAVSKPAPTQQSMKMGSGTVVPGESEYFDLSTLARSAQAEQIAFPAPPSGQRVRLRGGGAPYSGYLELFHADSWGLVCDSSSWTMAEADLVCKQLGFSRGLKSTTQGLIHGPVNLDRKMTESVECRGSEESLEKCSIRYTAKTSSSCDLNKDVVSITCIHDSLAVCNKGEVPWGTSCYSLHFNLTTFADAQSVCKSEEKVLVEITSQQENDLVSELLLASRLSPSLLRQIWTGGVAGIRARKQTLYWDGSLAKIGMFRNWWPGWKGERKGIPMEMHETDMAIKMSRVFDHRSQSNREKVERLTDYYFWMLEDFRTKLPFVCESPQKTIGCIVGNGESYRGFANRGESGDICLNWDSPELTFVLNEEKVKNLGDLTNNNYCRNPDGDIAPWCIAPNGEFDYCDIPKCNISGSVQAGGGNEPFVRPTVADDKVRCGAGQFQCGTGGECILAAYVCDGHQDCNGGIDEADCSARTLDDFTKTGRHRLNVAHLERWLHTSAEGCAAHCLQAVNYDCRSFNYHAGKRLCTLGDSNVGLSGKLILDPQWDYYELKTKSMTCDRDLKCDNGKCLRTIHERCDGKNDCGDNSDEKKTCQTTPDLRIRLVGGRTDNEGRIEVKALTHDFGGICDDGFAIEEADVICKHLGFQLGAKQALGNSHFGHGTGKILIDELECLGNETNLLDCKFDPWTQTDCSKEEWAGVICKTQEEECKEEEWRCASGECINLEFLCDSQEECVDGSDEDSRLCRQPIKARLVDGNNVTAGRLEVRYKSVWGTICDDNFGEAEAIVACRMLGFEGRAIVHSEAAYNPGQGPIWLHNVVCKGTENSLQECLTTGWGPTYQCKHLEDVGIECVPQKSDVSKGSILQGRISVTTQECGIPNVEDIASVPVARVASGMQSKPGSQPWAAAIRLQGSQRSFHWCGAVLVSEFYVLTVAHCMEDYPKDVYRVRIGDWDMQVSDLEEQEFKVEAVFFHENYNVGLYLNNDIAVVKLEADEHGRGVVFGDRVVPACLPEPNTVYGAHLNCTVSGWGSTGIAQPGYTRYLQSAKVPYLDTEKCMAPQVYGSKKLSSGMFCAGFLEGGVDTCQGDSGGGLVCDVRGRKSLLGLTSWGYGCGRPNRPGVYTKISQYVDWIKEKIA